MYRLVARSLGGMPIYGVCYFCCAFACPFYGLPTLPSSPGMFGSEVERSNLNVRYLSFWRSTAAVCMGLHGIPRQIPRHSTGYRGHSTGYRGHSTGFKDAAWAYAECCGKSGTPWRTIALAMAISTSISTATHGKHLRHTMAGRGTTERPTAMHTGCRWPWNMPWELPWYFGGLTWLVQRRLPRKKARYVPCPQPWHLPWKRHV